jgi:hypothetical protein
MSRDFWFGYFSYFCFSNAYMDMLGKETYLKKIDEYWMDTTPWLWLSIFFIGFIVYAFLEIKITYEKESK